jgi:hypothetical protein
VHLICSIVIAGGLCALSAPVAAQTEATVGGSRKVAVAHRIDGNRPVLDGRLDDAVWRRTEFISDFVQKMPNEGAAPTERTEVAFAYDDDALWVGARMYSDDPSSIQALMSRRDNGAQSQLLLVSLDTYRDRRTAYSFGVTAAGVRLDWYHPTDNEHHIDDSWDPVWAAEVNIDSLGWTAEMRIAFSQLRFNPQERQVWGLNVDRWIPERNEDVFWTPVPTSVEAWSSRMGELVGLEGIAPSRRIEVMPYGASEATIREEHDPANPFEDALQATGRVGADLKMGIGPNLTLDATINPDFGQVEADPAVVNLSAFEVFFSERRPFFTEGAQLLDVGGYFYSRRIGAQPAGPASGDFVDRPSTSTILGAAKLTGRTGSGWSVGALGAITGREHARTYDAATGDFSEVEVAPLTGYGVARLQKEFGPSQSTAGFILTGMRRDLAPGGPLAARFHRSATTGQADWNLRFAGGVYELYGDAGFTYVEGEPPAILRTQHSPVHYFQRPDADYVRLDSSRTSLLGYGASLGLQRISGRHWLWSIDGRVESPGLERNDIGQLGDADGIGAFLSLLYRETQPGSWYQRYSIRFGQENQWNNGLDRRFGAFRTDVNITFRNFWTLDLTGWVDVRAQNQSATRGGPSIGTALAPVVIARLGNSFSARTGWNGRVYYGWDERGGFTYRLSGGLSFRPTPRLQLSVSPNYLRYRDPRQYVTTLDGGPAATFGKRYVFAWIDRGDWSAPIRLNYAVTPDLTLEFYGEPFIASGRYFDHGELPAARSRDLRTYGTGGTTSTENPDGSLTVTDGGDTFTIPHLDFNVRSFRSNFVMRWEWSPGSTLYLVWQQDRFSATSDDSLVRPFALFDGLGTAGTSFFAVKVSYWMPVG